MSVDRGVGVSGGVAGVTFRATGRDQEPGEGVARIAEQRPSGSRNGCVGSGNGGAAVTFRIEWEGEPQAGNAAPEAKRGRDQQNPGRNPVQPAVGRSIAASTAPRIADTSTVASLPAMNASIALDT